MSQVQTVNQNNVREIINRTAEAQNILGTTLTWSVTGFRDTVDGVRRAVKAAGLDENLVGNVRDKTAFLKAVEQIAHEAGARVEKGPDNSAVAVRIIVYTHVDPSDFNVTVTTSTKAVLKKDTGTIVFRDLQGHEITNPGPVEQAVESAFQYWKLTYDSDQFRELVLGLLRHYCDYMTVRERGGLYFVPKSNSEQLSKIKKLFAHYDGASLLTLGVPDGSNERKFMWEAFKAEVAAEIEAMREDFARQKIGGVASDRSIRTRVERFQKLQGKVDNYAFLLQGTAESLTGELEKLAKQLTGIIGE